MFCFLSVSVENIKFIAVLMCAVLVDNRLNFNNGPGVITSAEKPGTFTCFIFSD